MENTPLFFSIVIPAHNEERYLTATLEHVRALDYPTDMFEVIVVENGSTDNTYEIAKGFEDDRIRVLQSGKGVSRAKNCGIDAAARESDWIVFLDADTILEASFLKELDRFLRSARRSYSVGTTAVRPLPSTLKARLWFRFYDIGHRVAKASYAISIVRRDLFPPIRFDEELVLAEDLDVIAQALKFGAFFFLPTRLVSSSTRRFEKLGWWRILFKWTYEAMLPKARQRELSYEVIR